MLLRRRGIAHGSRFVLRSKDEVGPSKVSLEGPRIQKATREDIVKNLVDSTKQFDRTQRELEELILQGKIEINRAEPIITEIIQASIHLRNILSAIDNPKTLDDIQETASSTRSITKQIDEIGNEINKLMGDEELMSAFRSLTIGLGEFFNEIYPEKTRN